MHVEPIQIYLSGALTILFLLVTALVLRKSRNIINSTFAFTTFMFTLSTAIGLIQDLTFDNVLPQLIPTEILDTAGDVVFLIAPLGLFYSSYLIIKGYEAWKSFTIILFTFLYLIIEFVLFSNGCTSDSISCGMSLGYYESADITRGLFNLIITLPLALSLYYFGKLINRMKSTNRNSVFLLVAGIGTGTAGQIYNSVYILLGQGTQILGLLIIVFGVFLAALSFSNIFAEKIKITQDSPASTPNPN